MFSFLILVLLYFAVAFYYLIADIVKNNRADFKMIIAIILLIIAVYLKSINL
jgi:hypothetical protein